jgi:hypothetical protein
MTNRQTRSQIVLISSVVLLIFTVVISGCLAETESDSSIHSDDVDELSNNVSNNSVEEQPVLNQGCYYYSQRDVWICDNYIATKEFLQSFSTDDIMEQGVKEIGIINTTGNYVLMYSIGEIEGNDVQFFSIYAPSEEWAHDLGLKGDLEGLGIITTSYEVIWSMPVEQND